MIISTTPTIQGLEIMEYKGVVTANEVIGVNAVSEFVASFTDGWGGRSGTFRRRFDELNQEVQAAITRNARLLGANAVVGYRVDFNEISGKGKQMFMAYASGTAVVVDVLRDLSYGTDSAKDAIIYNSEIKNDLTRRKIIRHLSGNMAREDWQFIECYVNDADSKVIIDKFDEFANNCAVPFELKEYGENVASYLSNTDSPVVTDYLYDKLISSKTPKEFIKIIELAYKFSPSRTLSMLKGSDKEMRLAIGLLKCCKKDYSVDDINTMSEICEAFNQEIKGSIETRKGMFGTKKVFVCQDGHETETSEPIENCVCSKCGKNAYGFTRTERQLMEDFIEKVEILKEMAGL